MIHYMISLSMDVFKIHIRKNTSGIWNDNIEVIL